MEGMTAAAENNSKARSSGLEGKVAFVTGGTRGIGAAIGMRLAEDGASVAAGYSRDQETAERWAEETAKCDVPVSVHQGNVGSADDCRRTVQEVLDQHGRLDILINNAGLNVRTDFRHMTDADWVKVRETNLDSVVRLSRDCFDLLRQSGRGVILSLASIMAERGMRQLTAYSATKGAVAALTRGLAVELAPFGIRVNYLAPGFIETALTARVLRNPAINQALIDQTPLRRFGTPEDIARAALFLVSDDAAYITGTGLTVDGGMTASL